MRNKRIIVSILIVVLLLLCGASLFAIWQGLRMAQTGGFSLRVQNNTVKAESVEEKTLTVSGPANLSLNNDFGAVNVASGVDKQVHIQAEKTAWGASQEEAQKLLEDLKVNIEQNGNNIQISVQQPEQNNVLNFGPVGSSVRFTITVPAESSVTVDSVNGDITLSGTTGKADLQTDFGSIAVSDVVGSVAVKTRNGNIQATDITSEGDVTLTTEFGTITAQEVSGSNTTITSTNGALDLQGIHASGVLKAGSNFGSISLIDSQTPSVEITSTNGKATLENVAVESTVTIYSNFGDQTLNGVDASVYDLQTKNGKIKVDQARGSITAQSDFGDIEVLNVENGTIHLTSKNGAITFSGSLAAGPHSVASDFGNISLTLPGETSLNVDLQTNFGKITSDFELTVSGALEDNHWVGKFNGGGEELSATTKNGNITINSK